MCGIAGFSWRDRELAEKMSSCLAHRGPDASGVFDDEGITLSHRRLAIIDLSPEANQPMKDASGELVIVFNGEIYNYKELRSELAGQYEFATQSDTEVILAGYRAWGKEVVSRLNGIFSFALYDTRDKSLFLARDHMGVKPLYYSWEGGRLIFASELKSILAHGIPARVDMESFNQYLRVLYVPEPRTMIEGIRKLPPGHLMTLRNGSLAIERYYAPLPSNKRWQYAEARIAVREVVQSAVMRQLVADVPVGIYLSGGIDSSAVLSEAISANKRIKTFSVGFELEEGEEEEKFNRDFKLARETAKHFGADHHELIVRSEDVAGSLEEVIGSIDDPVSNPTAIAMYHLSRFAKKHVTVVLNGNGGDELFGGYERYRMGRRADIIGLILGLKYLVPQRIREAIDMSALDRLVQFEFEKDFRLEKVVKRIYLKPVAEVKKYFAKYMSGSSDKTEALMLADLTSWLPDQALSLGDKMSMQGSIEERVPLLDREVVDLALSLPLGFKVDAFGTKKILKDAFREILPEKLFREPKRGWFSPGAKWLRRKEVLQVVRRVLGEDYYPGTAELFDWEAVREMLEDHVSKKEYNLTVLWAILTFQIWAKRYKIEL